MWIIIITAVIGVMAYLAAASTSGVWGFALDDAWIHQTYARNLVTAGQFAFVPGQPSAGSTSPLWTLLIALGYLVHADYTWWTYALGTLCLVMTALGVWQLSLRLFPGRPRAALIAGIFCALEWHLIWAAVSGMETALFSALSIWLLTVAVDPKSERFTRDPKSTGVLCGLLVLTRPEGLLLVGIMLMLEIIRDGWKQPTTWTGFTWTLAGMALLLVPWIVFNWRTSGTPFPNTFYAKQQEYAIYLAAKPLARRVADVFVQPFIGAQVLLIPGLIVAAWSLLRRATEITIWRQLAPPMWAIAHLALYALRLPVTYQHGRYEMPVIPVLIVFGTGGTAALLRWSDPRLWPRIVSRSTTLATALILSGFVIISARAYATDVSIIEGEMVRVARWLNANTAPGDLIAAHDIGAIGYFTQRPLLDLAGLISPEVIPFIRDEDRLESLIRQRGAVYLVTFPTWYPHMTARPDLVPSFAGNAPSAPEHLTAYRLPR